MAAEALPFTLNDELAAALRAAASGAGATTTDVALRADLPPLYVHRRLAGEATISVEDFVEICRAIGVDAPAALGQVLTVGAVPAHPPAVVAGT